MAAAADPRLTGKRMRFPEDDPPMAAAAGPRVQASTLQDLTERVQRLEQGRKTDMKWWKECANYVNDHGAQLDELHGEALQYNDNLHLVASDCREHTNALGRDTVQSLKVVETSILHTVETYNANFERWQKDSKDLITVIDAKVREIEKNLAEAKESIPKEQVPPKAAEQFHIGTPQAARAPASYGTDANYWRSAQGPLPSPGGNLGTAEALGGVRGEGPGGGGAQGTRAGEAQGSAGATREPLIRPTTEATGHGAGQWAGAAGGGLGSEIRSPPGFQVPGRDLPAPGQAGVPTFASSSTTGPDKYPSHPHPDTPHPFQSDFNARTGAHASYGMPVGPPPTGYYGTGWNNGQDAWGQPRPSSHRLGFDSKVLDIKYALDARNQYDGGEKNGESWRINTKDFIVGRMYAAKKLLEWAEEHNVTEVKEEEVQKLRPYMDEDPVVINHLLWAFLGINLTGSAKEMYRNTPSSNGLEVWRRLHKHVYARNEQRRAELYRQIHKPRTASKPSEVHSVLEEWDTMQRLHREAGGTPLREDELKELVLPMVPWEIRKDLIKDRNKGIPWAIMKDDIKDLARLLSQHGDKNTSLMHTEPENQTINIAEEFWVTTDDKPMDEVMIEVHALHGDAGVLALVQRRASPGWKGKGGKTWVKKAKDEKTDPQARRPMLCANCGRAGHRAADCKQPRVDPSERKCFTCGKPGHASAQCPEKPKAAKALEPADDDDGVTAMVLESCYDSDCERYQAQEEIVEVSIDKFHKQKFIRKVNISGAKYFLPQDSDQEDEDSEDDDDVCGGCDNDSDEEEDTLIVGRHGRGCRDSCCTPELENKPKRESVCCRFQCTIRGKPCTAVMLQQMRERREQLHNQAGYAYRAQGHDPGSDASPGNMGHDPKVSMGHDPVGMGHDPKDGAKEVESGKPRREVHNLKSDMDGTVERSGTLREATGPHTPELRSGKRGPLRATATAAGWTPTRSGWRRRNRASPNRAREVEPQENEKVVELPKNSESPLDENEFEIVEDIIGDNEDPENSEVKFEIVKDILGDVKDLENFQDKSEVIKDILGGVKDPENFQDKSEVIEDILGGFKDSPEVMDWEEDDVDGEMRPLVSSSDEETPEKPDPEEVDTDSEDEIDPVEIRRRLTAMDFLPPKYAMEQARASCNKSEAEIKSKNSAAETQPASKNCTSKRNQRSRRQKRMQNSKLQISNGGGNCDEGYESVSEWSMAETVLTPEEALERFKTYARWKLGKGIREGVAGTETQEHKSLVQKVSRFAGGTMDWSKVSDEQMKEFLWTDQEGKTVSPAPFYGVPAELRDTEHLRDIGDADKDRRNKSMQEKFTHMKNLDRMMELAYQEEMRNEYQSEDLRQYEEVNVLDCESIEELMAVEQKVCSSEYYKEPFEVLLDSGAGEHVANDKDAPGYMVVESRGSKVGQNFVGAGGHKMKNRGEMALALKTPEGRGISTTFQVSDVTRPLWSVARICDAGFDVIFSKDGARVVSQKGKVICKFARVGNLYKIKMDLKNPMHKGFTRPGPP